MKRGFGILTVVLCWMISSAAMAMSQDAALNFYFQVNEKAMGKAVTLPIQLDYGQSSTAAREVNDFPTFRVAVKQTVHGLEVHFFNKQNGQLITKARYSMQVRLENSFQTQGFTGLQYVHHPDGSVLQFIGMVK
ncbi:hypothetical protein [Endozoicomonas sp. OPT23]|uniref:hypothetical protein n=1 Tax=Endozoicomonas sp. OPT23 TaxID=2072845 RepID=UPI00129A4B45|nr:hypothetical protein [Endozoicomonas sp. OPT23]